MPSAILERRIVEMNAQTILNDLKKALVGKDPERATEEIRRYVSLAVDLKKIKSDEILYLSSESIKLMKKYNPRVGNYAGEIKTPFPISELKSKYL